MDKEITVKEILDNLSKMTAKERRAYLIKESKGELSLLLDEIGWFGRYENES